MIFLEIFVRGGEENITTEISSTNYVVLEFEICGYDFYIASYYFAS